MRFEVKAVNARNEVVALRLEAASEEAVRELVRRKGLQVLRIAGSSLAPSLPVRRKGGFSSTLLSIELLALLEAGLNPVEAFQGLLEKQRGTEAQRVLASILTSLREGATLSQALARFPEHFRDLYIATIRASERTGDLKEALARYIAYREEVDKVRKKVAAAAIYPAILFTVGGLVLSFLLFYVVPRFASVYDDVSVDLPFFSKFLLSVGTWTRSHGGLVLMLLAGAAAGAVAPLSDKTVRARLWHWMWRVPIVGEHMKTYQLARLYRTLAMLLRAGIPVVQAMGMVEGLLAPHLQAALRRAKALIAEGRPVSTALTEAGLANPIGTRMLGVGERGGGMGEMMERLAKFHDGESTRFVEVFTRVFEPVLMAVLGIAVGLVVVFMYMPIFELAGSIQ